MLLVLQDDSRKELYGDLLPVEGRQRRLGWVQARTIYLDKAIHDVRALPQLSSMCICGPMLPCRLLAELALLGRRQMRPMCSRACHRELREAHLPRVPCRPWRRTRAALNRWYCWVLALTPGPGEWRYQTTSGELAPAGTATYQVHTPAYTSLSTGTVRGHQALAHNGARHCKVGCRYLARPMQQSDTLPCLERPHGTLMHYAAR